LSIEYVILGFLRWGPATGYELKKRFVLSDVLYWSGSNNQIYRPLVKLHKAGMVTRRVKYQEDNPPRKIYTITAKGRAALREWAQETPTLPRIKHPLLIQLMWADELEEEAWDEVLTAYEEAVQTEILMLREREARRDAPPPGSRAARLWEAAGERWIAIYENELAWVRALRRSLAPVE
jgi:DNA-binding PadR family transcriptional regulator